MQLRLPLLGAWMPPRIALKIATSARRQFKGDAHLRLSGPSAESNPQSHLAVSKPNREGCGYGFRVRAFGAPRSDDVGLERTLMRLLAQATQRQPFGLMKALK
jgi:hypothetical protein